MYNIVEFGGMEMQNNYSPKIIKNSDSKRLKIIVVFIIFAIIVITSCVIAAEKVFKDRQSVTASEINNSATEVEDNLIDPSIGVYLPYDKDPNAEDVAFLEKYLYQQTKGMMPEGADGKKVAYLTFDDGPSETVTPMILDVLKEKGVNATFFVLGQAVDSNDNTKAIIKRMAAEGNAIGNHSYTHNYKNLYPNNIVSPTNCMDEIERTNSSLKAILGDKFYTRALRFPGGHMSWRGMDALDAIIAEKDYHQVDWNALNKDAEGKEKNADELVEVFKTTLGTREKALILMHDKKGKEETAKALPAIIDYLKEQGYEFKTIK